MIQWNSHERRNGTPGQAGAHLSLNPAYTCFQEDILGSITPGKLAEIVVLSQNILDVSPEAIKDTEIVYTITDAKIVCMK